MKGGRASLSFILCTCTSLIPRLYCKQRKAGWGLGMRLYLYHLLVLMKLYWLLQIFKVIVLLKLVLETYWCRPICQSPTQVDHTLTNLLPSQRWRQHFKSGQATANKRSLVHVHGGEGLQQAMCGIAWFFTRAGDEAMCGSICGIKMRGCRCSLVRPRWAPDPPAKERERLRETRTRRAKASLRGTPGPIVSSSDCLCSLRMRPTTR